MQKVVKATLLAIVITVLGVGLTAAPAHAQAGSQVVANVPFDFFVGSTALKAGTYKVEALESGVLVFSSKDAPQQTFALSLRDDANNHSEQPHLVFARYGTETFLNKVFMSSANDCNELRTSDRERMLQRKQATGEEVSLLIEPAR